MNSLKHISKQELNKLLMGWRQIRVVAVLFALTAVMGFKNALGVETQVYALFLGSLSLLYIAASAGVLLRKKWAVSLAVVMSFISMFSLPFGPLVGLFGLFSIRRSLPFFNDNELHIQAIKNEYRTRCET